MSRIAYFYCLFADSNDFSQLNTVLRQHNQSLSNDKANQNYEAAAVSRDDFHVRKFMPATGENSITIDLDGKSDCTVENLILTYMAVANSMQRKDYELYKIIFLVADDIWNDDLKKICDRFTSLGNDVTVEFYFQSDKNSMGSEKSEFETYMNDAGMYNGDAEALMMLDLYKEVEH